MKNKKRLILMIFLTVIVLVILVFIYTICSRVPKITEPYAVDYTGTTSSRHVCMVFDNIHLSNAYKTADDEEKRNIDLKLAKLLSEQSTDLCIEDGKLIVSDSIEMSEEGLRFITIDGDEIEMFYPNKYGKPHSGGGSWVNQSQAAKSYTTLNQIPTRSADTSRQDEQG